MSSPSQNQPGRLWHTWQYTKAMIKTFSDRKTEKDAKIMAKLGGTTTGVTLAGAVLGHYLYIPLLIPFASSLVTLGMAGFFGYKTWQKFSLLKNSAVVRNYVADRKQKWIDKKNRKGLFSRLKASLGGVGLALATAGKWAGFAVAAAATAVGGITAANYFGAGILTAQTGALSATAISAGAALGLTTGVSIGAAAGLLALAVPVGVVLGLRCANTAYVMKKEKSVPVASFRRKPAAAETATTPLQSATPSFSASAAPASSQLSPERQKAAEARAAARKARLKL